MRCTDLEHIIRAASAIAATNRLIIVGSQAILEHMDDLEDVYLPE